MTATHPRTRSMFHQLGSTVLVVTPQTLASHARAARVGRRARASAARPANHRRAPEVRR